MAEASKPNLATEEDFKLFNLTDVDRATLRQTDEEYVPHDWEELKTIIGKCLTSPIHQTFLYSKMFSFSTIQRANY